jgi:hypothetical protein
MLRLDSSGLGRSWGTGDGAPALRKDFGVRVYRRLGRVRITSLASTGRAETDTLSSKRKAAAKRPRRSALKRLRCVHADRSFFRAPWETTALVGWTEPAAPHVPRAITDILPI